MANKIVDGNKVVFKYDGPFYHFGVVQGRGEYHTSAVSFKKAKSNIIFQYKKEHGYLPTFNLTIDERKLTALKEEQI